VQSFTRTAVALAVLAIGVVTLTTNQPSLPARADAPATVIEQVRVARTGDYIVEKHVLMDPSVGDASTAIADAVTGITNTADDGVAAQYVLNPWKWPAAAMPVPVYYNPSLESPRPAAAAAVASAVAQWSAVIPSTFSMTFAGTTTAVPTACDTVPHADGVNVVSYVTSLNKGVLGLTCTLRGVRTSDIEVEFDMELAWGFDWGDGQSVGANQYDLRSTVLHEMGHAAGLGHSCPRAHDPTCTPADIAAVMFPALAPGQAKRTLTDDDKAGLLALYPPPIPPVVIPPVGIPVFNHFFALVAPGVSRE
jgi:hypothetical protein